jgi:hypothetical protein
MSPAQHTFGSWGYDFAWVFGCLALDEPTFLRLRSKAAEYSGDFGRQRRELEWSVGVVSGIGRQLAEAAIPLLECAATFDKMVGATHTPWRRDDPRD